MSMSFDKPLDKEQQEILDKLMGDSLVARDERLALFESRVLHREEMGKLANELKQPVKVEINNVGDEKTMSDGTKYKRTKQGWRKTE
ncbi:MAG: hypothetical protein ABFS03_00815 [Chloroflexota bacterium]